MSSRDRERKRRRQTRHLANALALDEIFTNPQATTALAAMVDEIRAADPRLIAHGDQIAAAHRELACALVATGARVGMVKAVEVPGWLRLSAFAVIAAWIAGEVELCEHEPHPLGATLACGAAWAPELVTCMACASRLSLRGTEADRVCDCCGHVCAGVERGDGIKPLHVFIGNLAFTGGVCRNCDTAAGAA